MHVGNVSYNEEPRMNTITKTAMKTVGWICRILGIWTLFASLMAIFAAGQAPITLLIPVALYLLGSWMVEGNKLFTFRWK